LLCVLLPQAQLGSVLSSFISCATGIQRLSRPELVNGLLGAKQSEVHELTPLADLVVPPECQELVRGLSAVFNHSAEYGFSTLEASHHRHPQQTAVTRQAPLHGSLVKSSATPYSLPPTPAVLCF
jgi:hypothetical protein